MAVSKKIDAKRVAKWTVALGVFFTLIGLLDMNNPGFSMDGRENLAAISIAIAIALISCAYFILSGKETSHRKIGIVMLAIGLILAISFTIALYALCSIVHGTNDLNILPLLVKSVAFSIVAWIGMMVLVVSITNFIGQDRTKRITGILGETRSEKIKLASKRGYKIWEQYKQHRLGMFAFYMLIAIFVLAVVGPYIAPENPLEINEGTAKLPAPPSFNNWFGTDAQNKDVWSQFLYGGGTSLLVGFMAGLLSLVIGTAIGLTAGYFGKASDEILMRLTDFFLVIPWFPLMIVLCAILGRSIWIVIFVIGITCWSPTARIVRAAVLSIKEKMYIERSRALGARNMHIIGRHIFPNVFPLIVATSILLVGEAIFSEAFLDFFGLGDPSVVSWGWMLERAHSNSAITNLWWWWILPPAIGIILLIMSFYLVGDTLDEILNPRLKRR